MDGMKIHISTPQGMRWLAGIYYLTKLDHLLCVPALIFLFLGLKRWVKSSHPAEGCEGQPL